MFQKTSGFRLRLFIYLAGVELVLSGAVTAFLAARQGLESTLAISVLVAFAGLICFFIPGFLKQKEGLEKGVMDVLKGTIGRWLPFVVILLLAVFFYITSPNANIIVLLAPLLICVWLIGLEFLLLLYPSEVYKEDKVAGLSNHKGKVFGIVSLLLAYGFLLLPSRVPTWFDGFPWDSQIEFIFCALILPLTLVVGWKTFTKRFFAVSFALLFIFKFIFFSLLPQSGLGIFAFSGEEAFSIDQWERSYQTFATPGYTEIINRPYYGLREFPIEWINRHAGVEKREFWLKLELSGYVNLKQDERLVFIVQGARERQVELLDINTQEAVPLAFIERIEDADKKLYKSIPSSGEVKIQGTLLFDVYGKMRLEPILLYPDGSTKSLFESPRVWASLEGAKFPTNQVNTFGFILNTLSLLFAGLILAGLFIGTYALWKDGKISPVDLYLASSGLPLFFVASLVHNQYVNVLAITVVLVFCAAKLFDLSLFQSHFSGKVFLFSIGIAVLCMFVALDLDELRMVNTFPPIHDGLEYQTFAHNIFVKQDFFLFNTPPRAYKVLFPYIVGFLHVLFGQSVAPQLFSYAWCAVLSGVIIVELAKELRMTARASLVVAVFYLLTLFPYLIYMYYFRFGLIEPFSTTLLLLTYYFAIKRRIQSMFLSGILTVLLRMDYLGITFAAFLLASMPMLGLLKEAWGQFFDWLGKNWKLLAGYMTALCLPILLVILGYFLFVPNYMLNAPDTDQKSLTSIPESVFRVIAGGTMEDLRTNFTETPADALLTSVPLLIGFALVLGTVFLRTGILKQLDLRLGLIALSLLPAYIFVRPTVYLPRFSLPLLPIDLILISLFLCHLNPGKWALQQSQPEP
ncbi:hypothetical protein ANAEL_05324 [Anaerolineales bacterium]|nr:hypothetical protein ANAEL_05324 [Anaerolineales bacterium]